MQIIQFMPRCPSPMEFLEYPWDRIAYKKVHETVYVSLQEYKSDISEELQNAPRGWWRT